MGYVITVAFLAGVIVVLGSGLLASLEHLFWTGHRRWFLPWVLVGLAFAAVGGMVMLDMQQIGQKTDPTERVPCEILEARVDRVQGEGKEPTFRVFLRTRWRVGVETYTMPRLSFFYQRQGQELDRESLEQQYRPGATIPCFYATADPSHVRADDKMEWLEQRKKYAASVMLGGLILLILGIVKRVRWEPAAKTDGKAGGVITTLGGGVLFVAALGGFWLVGLDHTWTGWTVVAAAAVIGFVRMWRVTHLEDRVMRSLRKRLGNSTQQSLTVGDLLGGVDGEEDDEPGALDIIIAGGGGDSAIGDWHGSNVFVMLGEKELTVDVTLPRWPAGMKLTPLPQPARDASETGDPEFDDELRLQADDVVWRPMLTHEVRKRLVRVLVEQGASLDPETGKVSLSVPKARLREAEARLEQVTLLGRDLAAAHDAVVDTPQERVLELIRDEPLPAVRLGHYRWLMREGWDMHRLLQQAEADDDPTIREWAEENRVDKGGAYR